MTSEQYFTHSTPRRISTSLGQIKEIVAQCHERARDISDGVDLQFLNTPGPTSTLHSPPPKPNSDTGVNDGPYALDPAQAINRPYLQHELWLLSALENLDGIRSNSQAVVREARRTAVQLIQGELDRLETLKAAEWARQDVLRARTRALAVSGGVEIVDTSMFVYLSLYDL